MSDQLSFSGLAELPPPPEKNDCLLLAIFPEAFAVPHVTACGESVMQRHGFRQPLLRPERFHVTLCHIDNYDGVPPEIVARVKETAARIRWPAFDVTFDRAASFGRPLVLIGGDGVAALKKFREALFMALKTYGPSCRAKPGFTPHITLSYDNPAMEEHAVEPVTWKVREFVLVHSRQGKGQHIRLGSWPLQG